MIVVDFQQTMIANLMVGVSKGQQDFVLNPDLLRHMVLNSLRAINVQYRKTHGQLVIAAESEANWRKGVFPYYKAVRQKGREESTLDWKMIFGTFSMIVKEVAEFMPYPVVTAFGAEADDVIGHLVTRSGRGLEPVVIVSGDKDFIQLHRYPGVSQWNHVMKREVFHPNAELYLKEKIMRGDAGDGVPNFLSDDDVFVNPDKRQKPVFAKRVEEWLVQTPEQICAGDERLLRNWKRNELLVDLQRTPASLRAEIDDKYSSECAKTVPGVFEYLVAHGLKNLTSNVQDF